MFFSKRIARYKIFKEHLHEYVENAPSELGLGVAHISPNFVEGCYEVDIRVCSKILDTDELVTELCRFVRGLEKLDEVSFVPFMITCRFDVATNSMFNRMNWIRFSVSLKPIR